MNRSDSKQLIAQALALVGLLQKQSGDLEIRGEIEQLSSLLEQLRQLVDSDPPIDQWELGSVMLTLIRLLAAVVKIVGN